MSLGPTYFDPAGRPITMEQWASAFERMERHVGETVVRIRGQWYRVSTVWLGLNHNWRGYPPLIYETMIFEEPHMGSLDWQWRYSTGEQAIRGHMRAVRFLKRNVRTRRYPQLIHKGRKPTAVGRPTTRK